MFPLKNIRKHLTDKLDEIKVFRKFDDEATIFKIHESTRERNDKSNKIALAEIRITNIPTQNIWIFDNEFGNINSTFNELDSILTQAQKGAFTSAGKKVEKTIIYYNSNRLYLFMIEMKRMVSPRKMQKDVVKKFESSLSTLTVFIAAHTDFSEFKNAYIYPVGICCYNYFDNKDFFESDKTRKIAGKIKDEYNEGKRMITLEIDPIALNSMNIPIFFKENPNRNPVTINFEIDLEIILEDIKNS